MSVEGLLNHKARVWRPTQSRGEYSEVVQSWSIVTEPTANNCEPPPISLGLADDGAGEARAGEVRRWYMSKDTTVAKFDVLELFYGPESPSLWRVTGVSFPRQHHYRLVAEPYLGDQPEETP